VASCLLVKSVSLPGKRGGKEDISMTAEENKAVVRREMEELFNHTGNLDVADEIIDSNYVSYEPTSGEVRGIEGAKQFAATFREAFPDLENTIEDMVAEGDKVVVHFRARGTHQGETEAFGPPTGKRMEITGITIKRLSEGKIVEAWTNFDALGMMQQLGLLPEAAGQQA
jgi:predicted ester cyclase